MVARDTKSEFEFLPAALEVQETPPSPIGRIISWSIVTLFTIAVVWAYFGEIDIVATAQGKIISGGQDKIIQPFEIGVVKKIYVDEGQQVKKGDPLIQMDTTLSEADKFHTLNELRISQLEALRLRALIHIVSSPQQKEFTSPFEKITISDNNLVNLQIQLLQSEKSEYYSQLKTFESQVQELKAKLFVMQSIRKKLEATWPIIQERADSVKKLRKNNLASKYEYLEFEQRRIEQEYDIATQKAQIAEIKSSINVMKQSQLAFSAQFKRTLFTSLAEVDRKKSALEKELEKTSRINNLQTLTAPVDGEVQQLAIHTENGVVTPAQALMVIVPKERDLEVEAYLANKDVGFVREGQTAEVKIEAFPFTKYGVIDGKIDNVSNNAIPDENLGLIYKVKVLMQASTIQVESKFMDLVPGMAVTVEVKTGKRRLIEYFLSPLMEYRDESVRER